MKATKQLIEKCEFVCVFAVFFASTFLGLVEQGKVEWGVFLFVFLLIIQFLQLCGEDNA